MNNRQLKFRAWSYTESKFYTRVLVGDTETDDPCSSVWNDEKKEWVHFDKHCGVIQQFTGLKDSKGVEIYEGDIVEFEIPLHNEKFETPLRNKKHIAVIKFCNCAFTVVAKSEDHWFSIKFLHEIHDDICNLKLIVIDNIFERDKPWERFENSELLNNEN